MTHSVRVAILILSFLGLASPAAAQEDAEGCKDHPLFTRMPGFYISSCDSSQFDLKKFPKGPLKGTEGEKRADAEAVEGPFWKLGFSLKEGQTKPSPLQIMRNFQNAAKKAGGTIEGEYPEWCKGMLDESLNVGNGCMFYGVSMRFKRGDKELWAYVQAGDEGESYEMVISEREAMKQDIEAKELVDQINKDGFVALYVTFETGEATIAAESSGLLDQAAAALKTTPANFEVAGHTDNVGTAEANQKLSEARAAAVAAALVARGIAASRLTPKGYGQSTPVADNRTEEGRAKNRRVELVKR